MSSQDPASPKPPRGVAATPGGLSAAALGGLVAALVVLFALLFHLAREPFLASLERLGGGSAAIAASAAEDPAETEPATSGPALDDPALDDPALDRPGAGEAAPNPGPRAPSWTLLDVEEAVSSLAPRLAALIAEGRSELPEFAALSSSDATRSARAEERFAAWARIWRNRVARLGAGLPPPAACVVHAAMDPACRALRAILERLDEVAAARDMAAALTALDEAAAALDLFLNPPVDESAAHGSDAGGEGPDDDVVDAGQGP